MKKLKLTKKQVIILSAVAVLLTVFILFATRQDLLTVTYSIEADNVDSPVRVVQISDLHATAYGEDQSILIEAINAAAPDLVLFTGDIFDEERPYDNVIDLLEAVGEKYTCFYVTGNHEYRFDSDEIYNIKVILRSYGVTVLEGNSHIVTVNGQQIRVAGVDDEEGDTIAEIDHNGDLVECEQFDEMLEKLSKEAEDDIYTILLSHRPEYFELYMSLGFDLVLSGHAHGGQVRIPGVVNGLFTPDEGFFPKYAGGIYTDGKQTMIVSRGLCKNIVPRVFNRPELVIVDVKPQNSEN